MSDDEDFKPLEIKDSAAAKRLIPLLDKAIEELGLLATGMRIEKDTALIAECPHKFNDVHCDDYWYAAQIGESYWEQSHFFEGLHVPKVQERTKFIERSSVSAIREKGSEFSSTTIGKARAILHGLEKAGWRQLAMDAFADTRKLICLAIQFDQPLLCLTAPHDGRGAAYTWSQEGFTHIATCGRIDQEVGRPVPIVFDKIRPDILRFLNDGGRSAFAPTVRHHEKHWAFVALVQQATSQVQALTSERVVLTAGNSMSSFWGGYGTDAMIHWCDDSFEVGPRGIRNWPVGRGMTWDDLPAEIRTLNDILRGLEAADWRELFAEAYSGRCQVGQTLAILAMAGEAYLIRDHSVFRINRDGIEFAGLCNRPTLNFPDWLPDIIPV